MANETNKKLSLATVATVVAVLVVIAGAWLLFNNYAGSTVFKINGKSYSKSEVKKLTAYQTEKLHMSFATAARQAYDQLRYQTAAKNANINAPQTDENNYITKTLGLSPSTYKQYKAWFDLLAYNGVVKSQLQATGDNREGYAYIFWFGDAIQPAFRVSDRSPKYSDQQAYKADQEYASQKANYYHSQLQNKKMTPNQVLAAILNDPKLALHGSAGDNPSVHFGTGTNAQSTWQLQLSNNTIANYVKKAPANSLSPIQTGVTATRLGTDPGSYVNAYYYIVQMQNIQANNGKLFKQAQSKLHAKFYAISAWL